MIATLKTMISRLSAASTSTHHAGPDAARRVLCMGIAAAGTAVLAGPLLLVRQADAAPMTERPDLLDALDGSADGTAEATPMPVQYARRGRRRWRRRELARLCRSDRRFRRENRGLCRRVNGRIGRPGACVTVGPVTICE